MSDDSHQLKDIKTQLEQETCTCGCMSQEKIDVEKTDQKLIDQH